jgi:UDP-N-acetylglucosamine--N-acetylmuramyl-(pentapeptide) pyrophosphoryl-undecaprenol N-acetylglucosamine transferase
VIAVAFDNLAARWPKAILTGMPIRSAIADLARLDNASRQELRGESARKLGLDPDRKIIAVFGGSLGSARLNDAIAGLVAAGLGDLQVIHAVGRANPLPPARPGYKPMAYFEDMPAIYGAADLLITRSGAVTCCELMTVARYAILVPLPHGNGEQSENAQRLVDIGLAISVPDREFDGSWLRANLARALRAAQECRVEPSQLHATAAAQIAQLALSKVKA